MLIVKKFGGSSVANKDRIFNVAKRCIEDYRAGHDVVVVLSAMGDTTDDLIALANTINPNAKKRELDMLLTTGEQVSVSLMAMAMQALDVPAVSLNAFQVMMHSTSRYGNARFKRVDTERIMHELDSRKIVIVTGFQGVNKYDDITTLGRGGSDTTAVALAAVLHADKCEIYTDVDGVFTADPRVVKTAKKLDAVTYDEMLELASLGAKVLHNRSVEMAKKYGVQLVVRSSMNREEGTVVKEVVKVEKLLISGVASDKNTARISVIGIEDKPGTAFKIFNTLAKKNINIDIPEKEITAFIGPSGCGKSTFLKSLNRMNDLVEGCRISGDIKLDGVDIYKDKMDVNVLRKRVGMVFQKPNPFPMSIYDNIAYGPRTHGIHNKAQLDEIVERSLRGAAIWDEVKDRLNKSALGMSGGQQQRLCIARALAVEPEVLLMDEPTSALDPISTSKVEELATELKENYTIVMVTHNMQQAARISDKTAFFLLGELVEMGPTERVFATPVDKRTEDYISGRFG